MARRASNRRRREWAQEQLEQPPLPEFGAHLWNVYHRLRRRCPAGMTVQPITFSDLLAFQRVTGMPLAPWEVTTIEALDDLYLAARLGSPPEPPEEDD